MAPGVDLDVNRPIASILVVGTSGNPSEAGFCAGSGAACPNARAGMKSANVTASAAVANRLGSP